MQTPQLIIHFLIAATQLLAGVFANGFIVLVNIMNLIKQRKMAPLDLLISCLATSRICLQVIIFFVYLVLHFFTKQLALVENFIILTFVNSCGLWLATWLGVFYCTKIATFPHPLFFWLKVRMPKLVPWLILGSLLYASIITGIYGKYALTLIQRFLVHFSSKNATQTKGIDMTSFSLFIIHITVPASIFLIAVLLLVFSLGRHTQQMRSIARGMRYPIRGALMRAMLSILSFLILYFSHYMVIILFFSQDFQCDSFLILFCNLMAGTYPSIHSVILILGNPNLKQNAKKFLLCGQCHQ
ncbi:taste receptor type 2 member 1-like [Fukomys damarensis]|uniref:taste receptor type 2 member 1-like n=1 Tax=Fukomys damarensis TaxID=885580 RepID=UPI000540141A|nr:taste receptor type 2 member 1-like [Fukomys damarensis]